MLPNLSKVPINVTLTGMSLLSLKSRGPSIAGAKNLRNTKPLTTWYLTSLLSVNKSKCILDEFEKKEKRSKNILQVENVAVHRG